MIAHIRSSATNKLDSLTFCRPLIEHTPSSTLRIESINHGTFWESFYYRENGWLCDAPQPEKSITNEWFRSGCVQNWKKKKRVS